ncbi:MAG: PH domain-containing protein [Alcanivorax sp.]
MSKETQEVKSKPTTKSKSRASHKTSQDRAIDSMLVSGEEVILRAELHWAIYWKAIAVIVLSLLLLIMLPMAAPLSGLIGFVGVLMLIVAILTQHFLLLAVTNKRVLARYGLLQMDVVDIRLSKVESIDLERMLPGHLLGYASVVVMGTGQRMIRVQYIANAEAFRRYYNEMVLAEEGNEEAEQEIGRIKEEAEAQERRSSKRK